jgi:hypothetical protein
MNTVFFQVNADSDKEFSKLIEKCIEASGLPVKLGGAEFWFGLGRNMQFVIKSDTPIKSWDIRKMQSDIKTMLIGAGWKFLNGKFVK